MYFEHRIGILVRSAVDGLFPERDHDVVAYMKAGITSKAETVAAGARSRKL